METSKSKPNDEKPDVPGHHGQHIIIVNGREKKFEGDVITFKQVVELAFGHYEEKEDISYTVTYSKGVDRKEGTLTLGQSVKVKSEMIFNVTKTNRS